MDHNLTLITTIAAGFGGALVFGFIAEKLRLPALVGYLLAGILIGPATPGFVADIGIAQRIGGAGGPGDVDPVALPLVADRAQTCCLACAFADKTMRVSADDQFGACRNVLGLEAFAACLDERLGRHRKGQLRDHEHLERLARRRLSEPD